jgi:hypothetical protein
MELKRRHLIAAGLSFVGAGLALAGIALVYPPAALIAGGGGICALGLLGLDVGGNR